MPPDCRNNRLASRRFRPPSFPTNATRLFEKGVANSGSEDILGKTIGQAIGQGKQQVLLSIACRRPPGVSIGRQEQPSRFHGFRQNPQKTARPSRGSCRQSLRQLIRWTLFSICLRGSRSFVFINFDFNFGINTRTIQRRRIRGRLIGLIPIPGGRLPDNDAFRHNR